MSSRALDRAVDRAAAAYFGVSTTRKTRWRS